VSIILQKLLSSSEKKLKSSSESDDLPTCEFFAARKLSKFRFFLCEILHEALTWSGCKEIRGRQIVLVGQQQFLERGLNWFPGKLLFMFCVIRYSSRQCWC